MKWMTFSILLPGEDEEVQNSVGAVVDENHPEVVKAIAAAVAEANKQEMTLTPDLNIEMLQKVIAATEIRVAAERKVEKKYNHLFLRSNDF